ncbi:hypothetical protein TWF703_006255 [Orbilia oligospora]|uniref:Uncharacterized protein n=1 Tax=Orbilia oligospora TaxID=2813651 RepID=A0A7C8NPU6_ORBOL|nr:hypothetical protein TWF703_006255 [Orbilia oligospora]
MPVGELMFEVISREAHDSRGINGNITPLGSARDIWMVHQNGQISIPPRSYQKHTGNSGSSFRETTRENFDWETAICSEYRKISMILKDQNKCDGTLDGSGIGILTSKTKYEFAGVLENDYNVRVSRRSLERVIRQMKDVKFGISVDLRSNEDGVIHNMMRQRRKLLQLAADWSKKNKDRTHSRRSWRNHQPSVPDDTRPQFTPLDGAVLTGDLAVARHLLEKGACIDLETLKHAISYGRFDMVSLLVQFDMKFHAPALELAELYKESVIQEYLEGRSLGRGLFGVPSEFVMFSRIDELEE